MQPSHAEPETRSITVLRKQIGVLTRSLTTKAHSHPTHYTHHTHHLAQVGDLDVQGSALKQQQYVLVPGTNFNGGAAGGPTVGIYTLSGSMLNAPVQAITGLRVVNSSDAAAGVLGLEYEVCPFQSPSP